MNERILGPVKGWYAVSYACPVGELGDHFVGCFKVFAQAPASYCDTGHVADGTAPSRFGQPADALGAAEREALALIDSGKTLGERHPHG